MTAALRRPELADPVFGLESAMRLLGREILASWVQDLGLVIEKVETTRPAAAPDDWQPGAVLRLPFAARNCRDGVVVCGPALMALADSAMFACAAAWNGYRPVTPIDQTTHFLRPVSSDVLADAPVVRIGRTTTFGRVALSSAADRRPVGMVSTAYAML